MMPAASTVARWNPAGAGMLLLAVILFVLPSSVAAETSAEAIAAFGLIGAWSTACPPQASDTDPEIRWDFRALPDGKIELDEKLLSPLNRHPLWETREVTRRHWDVFSVKRPDSTTIEFQRWPGYWDQYWTISVIGLSEWVAWRWPLWSASRAWPLMVVKERLVRDQQALKKVYGIGYRYFYSDLETKNLKKDLIFNKC